VVIPCGGRSVVAAQVHTRHAAMLQHVQLPLALAYEVLQVRLQTTPYQFRCSCGISCNDVARQQAC